MALWSFISSRKILNYDFVCIFKNFQDFPGHFPVVLFSGVFQAWKLIFSFSRFSRFSRCVGTLLHLQSLAIYEKGHPGSVSINFSNIKDVYRLRSKVRYCWNSYGTMAAVFILVSWEFEIEEKLYESHWACIQDMVMSYLSFKRSLKRFCKKKSFLNSEIVPFFL